MRQNRIKQNKINYDNEYRLKFEEKIKTEYEKIQP